MTQSNSNIFLMNFHYNFIQSRPSVFSSSLNNQHQQYAAVVNPEPLIPNSNVFPWSAPPTIQQQSFVTNQQQQPGFSALSVPQAGVPWRCPDWMVNQNIQPGSYMNFNGQQQTRLPFKRKGEPDIDT